MGAPPSDLDAPLRRDVAICVEGRAHRIGVWTTEHGEHRHYLPLCYYDGLAPPAFPPQLPEATLRNIPLTCLACLARDFPR